MNLQNVQNSWIKFNIGQTGFYRVNYPAELWKRFSDALKQPGGPQVSTLVIIHKMLLINKKKG